MRYPAYSKLEPDGIDPLMALIPYFLCLLLMAACSHETRRQNPLDAELTTAVDVTIAVDDTAGSAILRWSPYEGQVSFAHYLVLRQLSDRLTVDTLAVIGQREQASFADSSLDPNTVYVYRVSVVNTAGLEVPSAQVRAGPVGLPSIEITSVVLDAPAASATIEWSRYAGPDFRHYRVLRGTGADSRLVAQIDAVDSTRLVDTGLRGDQEYLYRVTATTNGNHTVQSAQRRAKIHPWVASWPLDTQGANAEREYVRLGTGRDGGIVAQISDESSITLVAFAADGTELDEVTPLDWPSPTQRTRASRFSTGVDASGRWMGLVYGAVDESEGVSYGVVRLVDGHLEQQVVELQLPDVPLQEQPTAGIVTLEAIWTCFNGLGVYGARTPLHVEDFSLLPDESWETETVNGWSFSLQHAAIESWLCLRGNPAVARREYDPSWHDFGVEVDVLTLAPVAEGTRIAIGDSIGGRLELSLDMVRDPFLQYQPQASLVWSFHDSTDVSASPRSEVVSSAFQVFPWLYSVHARIELLDSTPLATLTYPRIWLQGATGNEIQWTSVAPVGEQVAFTAGNLAYAIDPAGASQELTPFSSQVSEMRSWTPSGETRPHVAVCLPEEDQVRTGRVFGSRWRDALTMTIGPRLGDAGGRLFWPVSMAMGPDGRMYILDAGNHRVVVLDAAGQYITEFGHKGSADGEFDFGLDTRLAGGLDFGGSIALDDDGFIYVADTRNQRVQKFAP